MRHEIPTQPDSWHAYNVSAACTITEYLEGEPVILSQQETAGTGTFFASGSSVFFDTEGKFHVRPTKAPVAQSNGGKIEVDQTYHPESATPQSGKAVAEAFARGSTVDYLPAGAAYTMKNGVTVQLDIMSDTLELTPSALTTAQEMRVLYSPAVARTTPLIAVPQGVTLHWAGDEEPTWEVGKDYVIQLLQTAPTHIEARLFNAPQGAKLPDWLSDPESDFVAWGYNAQGVYAPVAGRLNNHTDGRYQFAELGNVGADISAVFASSTFAAQKNASYQFYGVTGGITLPAATFENQTISTRQFESVGGGVYLENATFKNVTAADYMFISAGNVSLPRATFENITYGGFLFTSCYSVYAPNFAAHEVDKRFFLQYTSGDIRLYSWAPRGNLQNMGVVGANLYFPSLLLDLCTEIHSQATFFPPRVKKKIYAPHLNLQALENVVPGNDHVIWLVAPDDFNEVLRQVVYGPKVVPDGEGGWKMAETTDMDDGIRQMIDPADVQGERMLSNGNKKTGFGIQDFRVTDAATGEFILDAEGNFTYPWGEAPSPHQLALKYPANYEQDADIMALNAELLLRGWQVQPLA